jgi:hypothetical protein
MLTSFHHSIPTLKFILSKKKPKNRTVLSFVGNGTETVTFHVISRNQNMFKKYVLILVLLNEALAHLIPSSITMLLVFTQSTLRFQSKFLLFTVNEYHVMSEMWGSHGGDIG